jgi:hypothetical protein
MNNAIRVLRVFLASPDDLTPEREAAEELIRNMNKHLADVLGWQIVLFRWEDAPPSSGRPQSTINKAVDDCALFIGMLWEKWGQATGDYTSGFEEEYERASARRKKSSEPEIWLVFKAVDSDRLKDIGPQLSKVLSFRDKQRSLNEVFYKEIAGVEDWKEKLQNWLWIHVVKLAKAAAAAAQPQAPSSSPEVTSQAAAAQSAEKPGAASEVPDQLVRLASSLTEVINSGDLEFPRSEDNRLDDFDIARIALLSATWMSQRQTGETLGTHEINLLYKHRKRLEATSHEEDQLFRTIVADTGDVAPGWFWFGDIKEEDLSDRLLWVANRDSSDQLRARAIDLLRLAGVKLPKDSWPALPFTDSSELVRGRVYKYLGAIGDESTAESLTKLAPHDDALGDSAINEAKMAILLRTKPDAAFSELVGGERYVSDEIIEKLQRVAVEIGDPALLKGTESQWEQLRRFSTKELAKRGRFPKELAVKLTKDPDVTIREMAFLELARQATPLDLDEVKKALSDEDAPDRNRLSFGMLLGGGPPKEADADSVILTLYAAQGAKEVLSAVDWFGIDGVLAYKSLATNHYDAIRDVLRTDLETNFARVRQQSIEAFNSRYGPEAGAKIVDDFGKYEDFIKSRFVAAGLSGIAANGEPSDIRFGRQYLTSEKDYVKLPAVRIVSRFGTAEDVPSLLEIAKNHWGDARDEAGLAALRLTTQPFEVARELAQSGHQTLVQAGFDWLYEQDSDEVVKFFEGLLNSDGPSDRERAVYFFSVRQQKENAAILERQFDRETYYYNVVTWLDRLLYAPEPLRAFFAGQLKRTAKGKLR